MGKNIRIRDRKDNCWDIEGFIYHKSDYWDTELELYLELTVITFKDMLSMIIVETFYDLLYINYD